MLNNACAKKPRDGGWICKFRSTTLFREECRRVLFGWLAEKPSPGPGSSGPDSRNTEYPSVVSRKPRKGVGPSGTRCLANTHQFKISRRLVILTECLLFTVLSSYSRIPCRKHSKFVMSVMMSCINLFYVKNPVLSLVVIPSNITYASINDYLHVIVSLQVCVYTRNTQGLPCTAYIIRLSSSCQRFICK